MMRPTRRPGAGTVVCLLVVALVLAWAVAPGLFTAQDPITGVAADRLHPPGPAHPFGTDQLGRDLFSRVVHGAAPSLSAALVAVTIGLGAGVALGLAAGWFGGWTDRVVTWLVEIMLSIPPVLLSLVIISAIGFGTVHVAVAVGVTSVAAFARVTRAEVLRARTAPYVEAAVLLGSRWWRVLPRYVLPVAARPVGALAALDFGLVVLAVSSLSFLGYGQPPPQPEWGSLVSAGRDLIATAWWLTALPGLTVAVVVLAANRLAHALQERTS